MMISTNRYSPSGALTMPLNRKNFYKGDELLFIEVIDIEETKIEEFVYDFSVKDNQNFF